MTASLVWGIQVAADPLAEGQLPGAAVPELLDLQDPVELPDPVPVVGGAQPVHVAQHLQGLAGGQVAPELGPLAEDGADLPGIGDPVPVRGDAVDLGHDGPAGMATSPTSLIGSPP
jgi:hypothetical protein